MTRSTTVKPKEAFRVLIVYPNLPLMLIPAIAVGLFTRLLKREGYEVDLFETTHYLQQDKSSSINRVENLNVRKFDVTEDLGITIKTTDMYEDFRDKVAEFEPDFIIYSVVEDAFLQCIDLMKMIEERNIPHLVGGVFPTYAPERCIEFPQVRMIGLGEGEHSLIAVAEAVRQGKPLTGILGTWYRDDDGKLHKNPKDPLVDLNDAWPDFTLFEASRFYRPMGGKIFKMIPIESYRGCPYACTFCNSPTQRSFASDNNLGNFLRRKTIPRLRDEIAEYMELYEPSFFYFVDDSFLARPRQEIYDFCDMYEEFGLPFWFNTRSENCNPDVLARLKEVGCYRISFGIECGNEEFRQKVLKRSPSNEALIRNFANIASSGIAFSLNLIVGMPGETRDLLMDTVELVRSIHGFDALTVSIFTPYHGTVLRDVAVKNGWLDPDTITRHTTSQSLLKMPPPYLNADDIDGLVKVIPLYCYFPKSEWEQLRRAENPDAEGLAIRKHYADIYAEEFLGEDQETKLSVMVEGGTGCRVNPKDAFRISPKRLTDDQIAMLSMPVA
jgi:radical SAM superfamily enzyme YgiQ (UPF0313 family)